MCDYCRIRHAVIHLPYEDRCMACHRSILRDERLECARSGHELGICAECKVLCERTDHKRGVCQSCLMTAEMLKETALARQEFLAVQR